MKIFLDDIRNPPDDSWVVVRDYYTALELIHTGQVVAISFDHDLGIGPTGYVLAKEIERLVHTNEIPPPYWKVHSANPVGARYIAMAMRKCPKIGDRDD